MQKKGRLINEQLLKHFLKILQQNGYLLLFHHVAGFVSQMFFLSR